VILIPLAYGAWIIFRGIALQDLHPNLADIHSLIYSVLISPSADKVVTQQSFTWKAPILATMQALERPDADIHLNLVLGIYFIVMLALSWRKLRSSYRLYTIVITLISFSYHTGPVHPYMGLPRHLLLATPVFIGLGAVIIRPWQRLAVIGLQLFGLLTGIFLYVLESWVP
jgi:hypothetical protein